MAAYDCLIIRILYITKDVMELVEIQVQITWKVLFTSNFMIKITLYNKRHDRMGWYTSTKYLEKIAFGKIW